MALKKITLNMKPVNRQEHSFGFTLLDRAGWISKQVLLKIIRESTKCFSYETWYVPNA